MANNVTIRVRVQEELGGLAQVGAVLARTVGGAIIPATAAVAALGVELVGAGAALGVFGAAVVPQISALKTISTEQDAYNKAVADYGKDSTQAATAHKKLAGDMRALSPATRDTARAFIGLKDDFSKWSDSLSGTTMPIFTKGIQALRGILPQLTPFVKDASRQVGELVDQFAKFSKTDRFKDLVKEFQGFSHNALQNVIEGMKVLAQTVAGWVTSEGFKNFLSMGKKEGPGIATMFKNLAEFVAKFVAAAGPLAGLQMKALEILADVLNSIPMPVLKILAPTIMGIVAATKLWTIAQLAFDAAADANPISLVIIALVALGVALSIAWKKSETFREIVVTAWEGVQLGAAELVKVAVKYFKFMLDVWTTVVGGIVQGAAEAFGWVPGIGPLLKSANKHFQELKKGVDNSLDGVIHKMNNFESTTIRATKERKLKMRIDDWNHKIDAAKQKLKTVPNSKKAKILADIADLIRKRNEAQRQLDSLRNKTVTIGVYYKTGKAPGAGTVLAPGHGFAHGGIVGAAATGGARSGRILVGEQGPEIVDLPFGSRVNSNPDSMRMMSGGGGGGGRVVLEFKSSGSDIDNAFVHLIRKYVRVKGGNVQTVLGRN